MFELFASAYNSVWYTLGRVHKIEKETFKSVMDPGTFLSGCVAGGVGRMAALPFDKGGAKGVAQTIGRRAIQGGFLFMFYVPVAASLLPGLEKNPLSKMATTFLIGACAGFNMRFVCNPISRVADECMRTGKSPREVFNIFKSKTVLQFWYVGPNLIANALYFGVLFTVFEGLRRFNERNLLPLTVNEKTEEERALEAQAKQLVDEELAARGIRRKPDVANRNFNLTNYVSTAVCNTTIAGVAALVASTACYPYSAHRYLQTVIYDSALCRGLVPTLLKEVPMMAATFGTFALIEPILSWRHGVRCGFGY